MPNPTFSVILPDIHQGPAFLWVPVPVPAASKRFLVDSSGSPVIPATNWAASTAYNVGDTVVDSNGNIERSIVAGTSGASAPTWPAAGAAGTKTTDNSVTWQSLGTPASLGASEGALKLQFKATLEKIAIDQETAPVDVTMTAEDAFMEFNLKEAAMSKLAKFLGHATLSSGTDTGLPAGAQAYEQLQFGGLQPIMPIPIMFSSPRRGQTSKFLVGGFYAAYGFAELDLNMTRTKESVYKVRFDGLAVISRAAGDRVGQLYRQT